MEQFLSKIRKHFVENLVIFNKIKIDIYTLVIKYEMKSNFMGEIMFICLFRMVHF